MSVPTPREPWEEGTDLEPIEEGEDQDLWEPPSPDLGGPGQLITAVVAAFVVGLILVGLVGVLSWLFRFG